MTANNWNSLSEYYNDIEVDQQRQSERAVKKNLPVQCKPKKFDDANQESPPFSSIFFGIEMFQQDMSFFLLLTHCAIIKILVTFCKTFLTLCEAGSRLV